MIGGGLVRLQGKYGTLKNTEIIRQEQTKAPRSVRSPIRTKVCREVEEEEAKARGEKAA